MQSHDTAENKPSARESYRQHSLATIRADGGQNIPTRKFRLVLEYTTMDGRRKRVTYVPNTNANASADTDEDADTARRITHERRDGEWHETGRQPISELVVHRRNNRSGSYFAGP